MRATRATASISLWRVLVFVASFHHQCDSFTINPTLTSKKVLFRQKLQSTPANSEENEDPPDLDLDPSQLEWLEKRSEMISQNQQQQQQQQRKSQEQIDAEEEAAEKLSGNVNIPKTGISVNDEMNAMQSSEKFMAKLFPLDKNGVGAIQTVTAETASDEPMRYLVPLNIYENDADSEGSSSSTQEKKYAMIDLPPFSEDLVRQMKVFMGESGSLAHILITCRNGVHYDEAPAVYVTRKSDMQSWKKAFPSVNIIMYRLDTPRDCKSLVTQTLDGYGPWALDEKSGKFNETGRPLTILEWDEEVQASVLDEGETPPDDDDEELDDANLYTPEAIREREANKEILAIYTPGHTYGSVSYIFPQSKLCCSGFTIPVEDTRSDASITGLPMGAGPKLDYSGYLTTSSSTSRQIESARHLASVYNDRFEAVLPSRGPPVNLAGYTDDERSRVLFDMLDDFAELGRVYDSLGIL